MNINEYLTKLGTIPTFLDKYLQLKNLKRLQKVGYFCGMDYASKAVYNFSCYISRFDHSVSCSLLTWKLTHDKTATLAALFHDIATPCFSHVIDYMNKDYETQESTECKNAEILERDSKLKVLLKKDNLNLEDIIDFKKYSIVDNTRPKLCVDRMDGIILTSLGWTKTLKISEVKQIIDDIAIYPNEYSELELGFKTPKIAQKVINLNNLINKECHSNYDTYMMLLLSDLTKYAITKKVVSYNELYILNEEELIKRFQDYATKDKIFHDKLTKFLTISLSDIPTIEIPKIKNRLISPIVKGERIC